jgi:hypothetical protein
MARKLSPKTLLSRLNADFTYKQLSAATGYSERQLQRIKAGQTSGARAESALREFYDLGKRAKEHTVEGRREIAHRRAAPERKPPSAPEPEAPPRKQPPSEVRVAVRGYIGPDSDPDYLRKRSIAMTLRNQGAAEFADLWERDEFEALRYAVSYYFGTIGPGHLESVIGRPSVKFTGGV